MIRGERNNPIGVFDSGIGGLTVLKEIGSRLPGEDLIYFGDTARVPYGTKSRETVTRFSIDIVEFLLSLDVKMIVVACNSASALALTELQRRFPLPIVGVIEPSAEQAAKVTRNGRIGVIGTRATVESGAYEREIQNISPDVNVSSHPCPVFVSLVEEGWISHPATRLIAREYLEPLRESDIDTLVLGCTHYPLLRPLLQEVMGEDVMIVDSARSCSIAVDRILEEENLAADSPTKVGIRYYVSDMPERFEELSSRFLGKPVKDVFLCEELGLRK